ncbi:MAG TPA: thrombospondin type 3 repeat-containing protein, partial [Polyangiaceae bacterium]
KSIDVAAGTTVRFSPFGFWKRATPIDFDQDGVADNLDNCPSLANPGQADTDNDGLGDACDNCPSGADQDNDGVCDAADNCPTAFNPNQRDTDNDGIGNLCDDQRCFTSLEPGELQRAAQLALADSRGSALQNNRHYSIVNSDAACKTRGPTAQRRVKLGLYDYAAEQGYRAVVNLTTSTVEQMGTSNVRMQATLAEVNAAIAVANQSPAIAPQLANFEPSLTSAEVGTMSGTECANKRCLAVVYVRRGGDATVTPPEGYISSVRWKGFNSGPTVFVTAADSRVITVLP